MAVLGIESQPSRQDPVQPARDRTRPLSQLPRVFSAHRGFDAADVQADERMFPRDAAVERDAEAELIRARVDRAVEELLRSHVIRSPAARGWRLLSDRRE